MTSSHSGDPHDPNNGISVSSSEDIKQDEHRPEARGDIANKPDVDMEPGQQPPEKSSAPGPETPPQDLKLVYMYCFPGSQLKNLTNLTGDVGWSK